MPDLPTLVGSRTGHFRLESGHHSDRWLDLEQVFSRPSVLRPFVTELARRVAGHGVDTVCGPLNGGAFLAELMALELGADFAFTERIVSQRSGLFPVDYRIPAALQAALRGRRVAIVDDAISAGSAVRGTLAEARACGAVPVVLGALIAIGSVARQIAAGEGIPFESLVQMPNTIWAPTECPMCALGAPLQSP